MRFGMSQNGTHSAVRPHIRPVTNSTLILMPKFSIIIPVYNVAPYLRECLDSVLVQTFTDWEAVCVDDGSTDESGAILDEYGRRDSRFVVIHQLNGGEGAARNTGLAVAKGEWICFLDSDDIFRSDALERFSEGIALDPETDLVSLRLLKFNATNRPEWPSAKDVKWNALDISSSLSMDVYYLYVVTCAYRAKVVRGIRFNSLKMGADRVYLIQALDAARHIVMGDCLAYGYRQWPGSVSHVNHTAEKFLHELRHQLILADIIRKSKKQYPREEYRRIGLRLIERYAYDYAALSCKDREAVWDEWVDGMGKVKEFPAVPFYARVALRLVVATRSRMLMWCLGYGMFWLKCHGLNRRFFNTGRRGKKD